MLICLSCVSDIQASERLDFAFNCYDSDSGGVIVFDDFIKIIQLFHFTTDPSKLEKKLRVIFEKKGLRTDDIVTRDDFFTLAKDFDTIFFPNV